MWSWPRQSKRSFSALVPAQVDFLTLCEGNVGKIEGLAEGDYLLNKRQCQDLSSKLSKTFQNIQVLVLHSGSSPDFFKLALENLYLHLEKARVLVDKCGEEDWCAAAVFQIQNENAFREILLGVSLCYNAIYEQATTRRREEWNVLPEDLRKSSIFLPAIASDVRDDQEELQNWLEYFVGEPSSITRLDEFEAPRRALQQCLARYLLVKLKYKSEQSQMNTFDGCRAILWTKEPEVPEAWTNSHFLGSGAGANGVCRIEWLGIPCAKKEFHEQDLEPIFLKEAAILAGLQHPRIVNFICCGNGQQKGDCFIAMELMEKSLFDLIKDRKNEQFSLPVVVDMMAQMARGMLYLHDQGVAHRDLKPQNVVVNRLTFPHLVNYYCVKLVDFGMSKTKVEVSKSNSISFPGVGTTRYRAPEVHPNAHRAERGNGKVNWFRADVYSFAVTCAHVLTLKLPFGYLERMSDLYNELLSGTRPELPSNCPQELVSLLRDCWNINPRSRPSFREICTRLEKFRYKILKGFPTDDHNFQEERMDLSTGCDFIEKIIDEQSLINKDEHVDKIDRAAKAQVFEINRTEEVYEINKSEEVVEIDRSDVLSIITCTSNHALELLQQSPYEFFCNMCRKPGKGLVYHCKTCDFDAHPDCAAINEKLDSLFFHDYPLHLIRNDDNDSPDAICSFCQEPLQDSKWVYKSEIGNCDVHALCAKYSKEIVHPEHVYEVLTLVESPPGKTCTGCNGDLKGYNYTCILCNKREYATAFDLHPFCAILPLQPRCMNDTSHHLTLSKYLMQYSCWKCESPGTPWSYRCDKCTFIECLDCGGSTEEHERNWNVAYDKFTLEYGTRDYHTTVNMISNLVDRLYALEATSSPSSRPQIVIRNMAAMKIRRKVKEKPNLAKQFEKLEKLNEILHGLNIGSNQAFFQAYEATREKLRRRLYLVHEASQMQS